MKKKFIDLQAIREARANLDKLAREHPELLGPSSADDWEDILKGQSTSERQRALKTRRRAKGLVRVTIWLSETTRETLRERYPGPRGGIDWESVTGAALQTTQGETTNATRTENHTDFEQTPGRNHAHQA